MKTGHSSITRRSFIRKSAHGAGLFALCPAAMNVAERAGVAAEVPNAFTYDVEHLVKTDPALLKYEEVKQFKVPKLEPRRLELGPDDHIYVATKAGVSILDRQGESLGEIVLTSPARCVAVASDGMIYAGVRDHIEVFNAKGIATAIWEGPGGRSWLTGLTLGESNLFAADSGNRAVLHYDRSGKLKGRIGEKSKQRNIPGLIVPSPYMDVALARDGLLRVTNPGRHRVEVYTPDGDLEISWGRPSNAIDGFCGCCNPVGIALLPDAKVVTCEKGLPRVKVHRADGSFESVVAGPESFPENARRGSVHDLSDGTMGGLDAAVDSQGRIYILDLATGDVRIMRQKA